MKLRNLILDMDGVLWRGDTAAPGLVDFFAILEEQAIGYILATNNATKTAAQYTEKLARLGVSVPPGRILTSSEATAAHLRQHYPPGTAVYVVGEAGLQEALAAQEFAVLTEPLPVNGAMPGGRGVGEQGGRGAEETQDELRITNYELRQPPPLVVAGLNRQVTYAQLATAVLHINAGARFIATNPDPSLPSEWGQLPGAGALLAFITTATGVEPTVVGKPGRILFEEALRRLNAPPQQTMMVGDRLTTDIAGGAAVGMKTILLLSGVATLADVEHSPIQPDYIFDDLAALGRAVVSSQLKVKS